ncbi:MAG: OmpH family outer membrane protein [Phycisphaeraceae bacterium JB051]
MQVKKLMGLVMVVAMMGVLSMPGKAQAQARPTAIAVIDVEKAMVALEEKTQVEADMKTEFEQIKQDHEGRRTKLKQMKEDMDLLQPGTDAYMKKAEEFNLEGMQLEAWYKYKQARMQSESVLQLGNMYRKLIETVGKIAGENGYDMVLFKEKQPSFNNVKPEALSTIISMRKVLWVRNDLDITDQVVQRMNNEWRNRK